MPHRARAEEFLKVAAEKRYVSLRYFRIFVGIVTAFFVLITALMGAYVHQAHTDEAHARADSARSQLAAGVAACHVVQKNRRESHLRYEAVQHLGRELAGFMQDAANTRSETAALTTGKVQQVNRAAVVRYEARVRRVLAALASEHDLQQIRCDATGRPVLVPVGG